MHTKAEHRALIAALAKEAFSAHVVEKVGSAGDTEVFQFGKPRSVFYRCRILFWPGWVVVAGDVGDTLFQHSDSDSVEWARRAIYDVDYLLGKVQQPHKEFMVGDAAAYIQAEAARLRDGDFDAKRKARDLLDSWDPKDDGPEDFYRAMHESGDVDPPDCLDYAASHLWAVEALRYFLRAVEPKANGPVRR